MVCDTCAMEPVAGCPISPLRLLTLLSISSGNWRNGIVDNSAHLTGSLAQPDTETVRICFAFLPRHLTTTTEVVVTPRRGQAGLATVNYSTQLSWRRRRRRRRWSHTTQKT